MDFDGFKPGTIYWVCDGKASIEPVARFKTLRVLGGFGVLDTYPANVRLIAIFSDEDDAVEYCELRND